ncbi:hypothetical protein HOO65_060695 [Ceratocystis lukuohia]|uniref:Transcriptional activator n=3 Tax=Ceratocystis TaxID=5157 RepID=A0A0F8B335_CERFI|nr:hypothetical protein CFO_g1715 [Ceratocystis platani]PHH50600.1 hypothetical protein CFIMG_006470RA [Ceratocystis fimbriata CBS 114723]
MPGHAAILYPSANAPDLEVLATEILDDALYNILHDLVMKTHRDEKMARAVTAAIRVEKQAADATDGSLDIHPEVRTETDAAVYEEGRVTLKGNPLKTIKETVCPKCHLPRLHHPVDGKGAQKPDPSVIYCKRMPFIDKPNHDIYGQTWVPLGPGRGKKKKDMEKRIDIPADQKPANLLSYPSATCSKCKRCILVTRLNNHMGSCIGNSGRVAGRAAAQKISSANASGANSQHEPTPPLSRRGTPVPPPSSGTATATTDSTSSRKRDLAQMNAASVAVAVVDRDSDAHADSDPLPEPGPKKKKMKVTAVPTPKIKIKAKSMTPVPIPNTGTTATTTTAATASSTMFSTTSSAATTKKEKDRDEKQRRTVSESPIIPPKALSPSKGAAAMNLKKQKTKAPSPLKKMTKVKPPAPPGTGGGVGAGGKKARALDKSGLASSPAR